MTVEAEDTNEPLELEENQEIEGVEFEDDNSSTGENDDGEETVIGFGDEGDAEGEVEETPLVKRLRDQLRQTQRQLRQKSSAVNDEDPEPTVPVKKRIEDFEYDGDRFDEYDEQRTTAIQAHAEWKVRQSERDNARQRMADDQAKQVEQQKRALGVSDYDERASVVRDRLNDAQMAVLINATDNPARLLYALGRSEVRLDELASIDNLAKFAARIGQMEGQIKVTKRKAPPPETQVRGATASTAITSDDKELARLEKEADRSGDRSKVIAYKRRIREQRAA